MRVVKHASMPSQLTADHTSSPAAMKIIMVVKYTSKIPYHRRIIKKEFGGCAILGKNILRPPLQSSPLESDENGINHHTLGSLLKKFIATINGRSRFLGKSSEKNSLITNVAFCYCNLYLRTSPDSARGRHNRL